MMMGKIQRRRKTVSILICFCLALVSLSCSVKKMAMNSVANALSTPGSDEVFAGDNDPELVGDALPFAIKMYESLLASLPAHRGLRLRTGSLYVMYANAFLQTPADVLPDNEYREQEFLYKRAKNLYLRGRDILLTGLEQIQPGFREDLDRKKFREALDPIGPDSVPFLYWAAAGWLGAFAIDPFDMKLMITLPRAAALMARVEVLDSGFRGGAVHDFYTLYYGSVPEYMGGDFTKARQHFEKAVALSRGKSTSPYLSLATTVCIKEQNPDEFKSLLQKVLAIDVEADPENRLLTVLNHRKARWFLAHIDNYFLELNGEKQEDFKIEEENP